MTPNLLTDNGDLPEIDPSKNYLTELVGDDKKFKTVDDLARGKFESDQYIEILKQRQDELRRDYLELREDNTTKAKLEELLDQLKNNQQHLASNENTQVNEDKKPGIEPKDIEAIVNNKILERERNKTETDNVNIVKAKLKERLGTKASEVLTQRGSELGLSTEDLNTLARKSPNAFFKTLGLDDQPRDGFQAPPVSSQRNDNFSPKGAQKRTWQYYQELKKTDPKLYYNPKIAVQMQNDAIELGEAFRDGDYFVRGLHDS